MGLSQASRFVAHEAVADVKGQWLSSAVGPLYLFTCSPRSMLSMELPFSHCRFKNASQTEAKAHGGEG